MAKFRHSAKSAYCAASNRLTNSTVLAASLMIESMRFAVY